jgi:hypothetical protein
MQHEKIQAVLGKCFPGSKQKVKKRAVRSEPAETKTAKAKPEGRAQVRVLFRAQKERRPLGLLSFCPDAAQENPSSFGKMLSRQQAKSEKRAVRSEPAETKTAKAKPEGRVRGSESSSGHL